MSIDWQTPLAFFVVALALAGLVIPAWRRRAESGGCASGGEGCGCTAVKKNFRK